MPAYLYVMRSACSGRHAVGATVDLDETFIRGAAGHDDPPGHDAPWECVYIEICDRIEQAEQRVAELGRLDDPQKGIELLYTSRIQTRDDRGRESGRF